MYTTTYNVRIVSVSSSFWTDDTFKVVAEGYDPTYKLPNVRAYITEVSPNSQLNEDGSITTLSAGSVYIKFKTYGFKYLQTNSDGTFTYYIGYPREYTYNFTVQERYYSYYETSITCPPSINRYSPFTVSVRVTKVHVDRKTNQKYYQNLSSDLQIISAPAYFSKVSPTQFKYSGSANSITFTLKERQSGYTKTFTVNVNY